MAQVEGDGGTGPGQVFTPEQVEQLTQGLRQNNAKLLEEKRAAQAAAAAWTELGADPDHVRAALTEWEALKAEQQKAKGDWQAREQTLRAQLQAERDKEVRPLRSELEALQREFFEALAVREAQDAASDREVDALPKLALPLVRDELDVQVVNGTRRVVVRGADGQPRMRPDGELLTVKERLLELKALPDYAPIFRGAPGNGSGARPTASGTRTPQSPGDFATMKDKLAYIKEHGARAYEDLVTRAAMGGQAA